MMNMRTLIRATCLLAGAIIFHSCFRAEKKFQFDQLFKGRTNQYFKPFPQ